MTVQVMVAGFLFCERRVLLVNKRKPKWQNQLWNAVGGKAESRETPVEAMVREFREETGQDILDWVHFCTEIGPGYVVHFFRHTLTDWEEPASKWPLANDAGEPLTWAYLSDVPKMSCVGNLTWLVPLALDPRGFARSVVVETMRDIKERPTW